MKNKKAFIFLLLAAVMLCCLIFTGCGSSTAPEVPVETEDPVETEAPVKNEETAEQAVSSDGLSFSTTALDGSAVDESIFEGKSLIMINLWEPWCGPCVQEMPDLQKIYEEYKDKGFLLVGTYSTEDGTANIVEKLGITYPIIKSSTEFNQFQTGYVPTTVFLDGDGKVLGEPVVGSASYQVWKDRIDALMP